MPIDPSETDPAARMQSDAFDPASNHLDARIEVVRFRLLWRHHQVVVTRHDTGAVELRVDANTRAQAGRLLAKVHSDLHSKSVIQFFREWRVIS